jgi:hypothetical protein
MSTNPPTLTREQWQTVPDDTDRPTFGELVSTIEAATMTDAEGPAAEQLVTEEFWPAGTAAHVLAEGMSP